MNSLFDLGRPRRSVRTKLAAIVMLTALVVLIVAGAAMLIHDLSVYRKSWASDVSSEANILALTTAPALAFDDVDAARRSLDALSGRPAVEAAALYEADGSLYASYTKAGAASPPATAPTLDSLEIRGSRLRLRQPVAFNDETLGSLYLEAHYDTFERVRAYLAIFSVIALVSLVAALVLSAVVQRVLTVPLEAIARVAQGIVHEGDYSLRVTRSTEDEIGLVVQALNRMLDEVQQRKVALEETNASLREQIAERQRAERLRRETEGIYRAIGESIDYGVWITDAVGRGIYVSDSFLRLTGLTIEEVHGRGWTHLLPEDEQEATRRAWTETQLRGESWYRDTSVRGVDGTYHPVLTLGVPIRADDGTLAGWAGINLDISTLKRTEEALREADRRKDEFLATLAHELRNPLAPIRQAARILDAPAATPAQHQWCRDVIGRQVTHMALLLDDLLDVSRITRGRMELRPERVALERLIGSAVETTRPLIDSRRHRLDVDLPSEPVELVVDPLRVSQALSNLLTNAAKYTDSGGHIRVVATRLADGLSIAVTDNGIGLQPGATTRVFEMFSQIESAIERSQGGLGIGLALVKGLIELHGGSVSASSEGPGRGSTFTVSLPENVLVDKRPAVDGAASPVETTTGAGRRVLVVDDNRDAADSLAIVLSLQGHDVHVAHSGQEALAMAREASPEVFVLDIGMPDMSGYALAEQLRASTAGRGALLIAVTGFGQADDKQRAHAAGFDLHFTKPVDPGELDRAITAAAHS